MCKQYAGHYVSSISVNLHKSSEVSVIHIFQRKKKLRIREVIELTQGHIAGNGAADSLEAGLPEFRACAVQPPYIPTTLQSSWSRACPSPYVGTLILLSECLKDLVN